VQEGAEVVVVVVVVEAGEFPRPQQLEVQEVL